MMSSVKHRKRAVTHSVLLILAIWTVPSLSFISVSDGLTDVTRFCNLTVTEEFWTQCVFPCPNVSSCPLGSVFMSSRECAVEDWMKALAEAAVNVTEDYDNTTDAQQDFDDVQRTSCQSLCSRDSPVPECCPGFFGPTCFACPGYSPGQIDQVCNGHGVCSEGIFGNGTCQCDDAFTGYVCHLCKDSAMYGPNCSEECKCVNGYCDNGPSGTGNCSFCFDGFRGHLCDEEIITCSNLTCGNFSECEEVSGSPRCVCRPGYEADPSEASDCIPVDPCKANSSLLCGERDCIYTGPGTFDCRCPSGHLDDGVTCHMINPCNYDNGGCDVDTSVCMHTGANTSTCDCLAYYENYVEGEGCSLVDVCPSAKCHENANCSTVGPNDYRCSCLPGYVGDGTTNCFGNILDRLKELNVDDPKLRNQLSMAIGLLDRIYPVAIEDHGPFTIFVPNNRAFKKARRVLTDGVSANLKAIRATPHQSGPSQDGDSRWMSQSLRTIRMRQRSPEYASLLRQPQRAQQVVRQHILLGSMTLEDLQKFDYYHTLQGNIAELQVRVAKDVFKYRIRGYAPRAKIISRNLPAFNGMIHVVNELLINDPVITGDNSKTALELIHEEGRFNRLQSLISTLGLESMFERDNITVFASENGGLDELPEGTLEYLTTEEDGKAKLRTFLENHIFPGKIPVTDLINLQRIRSIANYAFDVKIGDLGRIVLNGNVNISQANIRCKNAVYYHIDGPLVPEELADMLPSRCDIVRNTTVQGRCTTCDSDMKCPLESDAFQGEVAEGCRYWGKLQGRWTEITGCKPLCVRSYRIPKCCAGFYGKDCRPCPGGHKNPCGGHGECSDEMYGTGFCICNSNFRGDRCEKCLDRNKYGPNCTEPCSCLHGQCDGGPEGTGRCVQGSCYASFRGDNCDLEVKRCRRGRVLCHLHAECISLSSGVVRCECSRGYEGDGKVCKEIDPCEKSYRGHCHTQAKCTKIGPGSSHCECEEGWFGDGFSCSPIVACNASDHCHPNASCINLEPGMYSCKCEEGFEGNGTVCTEIDGCLTKNGGCHPMAICTPIGPGTVNCTCPDNYLGDGTKCFTTIAGHIMAHPNLTLLAGLIKKQDPADVILGEIGESFTFFAPTDDAMQQFLDEQVPDGYFDDEETIMNFFQIVCQRIGNPFTLHHISQALRKRVIPRSMPHSPRMIPMRRRGPKVCANMYIIHLHRFHSIAQDYTLQELMALEGIGGFGRWATLYDGYSIRVFIKNRTVNVMSSQTTSARVVEADIAGLNGHLHLIDGVLEPFLPDAEQPFLSEFFGLHTEYTIFGQWLEKKDLIKELQAMDHYTLFVPNNSIFLPDTVNHTITTEYLKYYIVPNILLTPAIDDQQTASTLLGDTHMLQFTTNGSQVSVNGVKITHSNNMMMEGVVHVIDGLLHPVINFCNRKTHKTVFGLCGPCSHPEELTCEEGFQLARSDFVERYRCRYSISDRTGMQHKYLGCRKLCERNIYIPQCCAGYYGPNCTECPGGPERPCGGQGVCDEGIAGSGYCVCEQLYTGTNCQDCIDRTMAGPFCNISKESCQYQNGNCSENAECSESESGDGVHCRCRLGYVGDGYTCTSPCDSHNGGCHANATCSLLSENQTVSCTCKQGFHGNGVKCQANRDGCEENRGGCSAYADCRYTPPPVTSETEGEITCTCLPGYVGNGTLCVTTILNAIRQISETTHLHEELLTSSGADNVSQLLGSDQSAVTVFIPIDLFHGRTFNQRHLPPNINNYVVTDIVVLSPELVEDSSSSSGTIHATSGMPLPITFKDGKYYVKGSDVLERNIPAVNGYINLLKYTFVFLDYETGSSSGSASSEDVENRGSQLVVILVPIAVLLVVAALVVGAVVCYHRSQAVGFLDFVKIFRKGSDASMSFARLKAQESEDDVHNPFSQPDNVNFDNPLYNDPQ